MNQDIAHRKIIGIKANGEEFVISLRIGAPCEENENLWGCPVAIDGLYENLSAIYGVDSYQALVLATNFIKSMLQSFIESGGSLEWPSDRSSVSLTEGLF